ncbi:MAG: flagellar hook-length control protein FliK [Sedimentisphaerales bacterium]
MSSAIIMNLPVAVIGQPPAASENPHDPHAPQGQFADVLLGSSSPNVSENVNFSVMSDNLLAEHQIKSSACVKEAFAETFKKAMVSASGSDVIDTGLNTNQSVLPQAGSCNTESAQTFIPASTETAGSADKKSERTPATETPALLAISPISVLPPIEPAILSPASDNILTPIDNSISQESIFLKPTVNNINISNVFEKYADTAASDKNFQNSPAVELTDNLITTDKTQSNQTETTPITNENPEPLQQTVVATKDSTVIKPADADVKKQNTVSNQNFTQKVNTHQPQTNAENSRQTPFEQSLSNGQGFDKTYQETDDIQSVSFENKISGDLQTLPIQEIKTAGGAEKVSSPIAVDLKTDIKRETGEISKQIADSIKSAANTGEKEITVRLNPAELGKVVIKVSGEHSQITTIIEASNPETKSQLQEAFGQVAKNLADAGITLKHFEVRSAQQSAGGFESAFSQSGQSSQSGHGGNNPAGQFFQNQNPADSGFYYRNQTSNVKISSFEQNFSQNHFTARSVNMLA